MRFSSDVYSFGVIVWEVMTGEVPWADYDPTQIMTALLMDNERLPPPNVSIYCPAEVVQLMRDCFGDAETRPNFPTVLIMLERLLQAAQQQEREHIPEDFLCPITFEIMEDPVICCDGHSYERAAIERWLTNHNTSPKTNAILQHHNVTANIALRGAIGSFLERRR